MNQWQQDNFGTQEGMAADSADPDGDGQSNFLEYALGTDPMKPDAVAFSLNLSDKARLIVNRPVRPTINYTGEASPNLEDWTLPVTEVENSASQSSFEVPANTDGVFLRLKVSESD